jgi:hypothetical protein
MNHAQTTNPTPMSATHPHYDPAQLALVTTARVTTDQGFKYVNRKAEVKLGEFKAKPFAQWSGAINGLRIIS